MATHSLTANDQKVFGLNCLSLTNIVLIKTQILLVVIINSSLKGEESMYVLYNSFQMIFILTSPFFYQILDYVVIDVSF